MYKDAFFVKNALNCSKIMDIVLDFVNELVYNTRRQIGMRLCDKPS